MPPILDEIPIKIPDFLTEKPLEHENREFWGSSSSSSTKPFSKEKEYAANEWDSYNSHSRSKYAAEDETDNREYNKKYFETKRERGKDRYENHYERSRDSRRDYRNKETDWKDRSSERTRKDSDFYKYSSRDGEYSKNKDSHRYGSSKSYSSGYGGYSAAPAYDYNYSSSSSSTAAAAAAVAGGSSAYVYQSSGYQAPAYSASSSSWAGSEWEKPKPPPEEDWDSPPHPPPEPPKHSPTPSPPHHSKDLEKDEHGKSKFDDLETSEVDLDTRIAMMFKSKTFGGGGPPFLGLGGDSDEENKDEEDGEVKDDGIDKSVEKVKSKDDNWNEENWNDVDTITPDKMKQMKLIDDNSESCSKDFSAKLKLEDVVNEDFENANIKVEDNWDIPSYSKVVSPQSSVSSVPSAFETLTSFRVNRKYIKTRKQKRTKVKVKVESGASDISSSEDELLAKGSYSPPLPTTMKDDDQMSLSSLSSTEPIKMEDVTIKGEPKASFDPSSSSYLYPSTSYPYDQSTATSYPYYQYFQQFPQSHYMQPGYESYHYRKESLHSGKESTDPHEVAVKSVITKLVQELKQILKKDFNKRMIENTAFKKFEAWWDEQERNKNTRNLAKTETVTAITPVPVQMTLPLVPSAIDKDDYSIGVGLGLGIPRNLRFTRIKKAPVVIPQEEEDSRKSDPDDDDMVHGSDSDKEDEVQPQSSKISFSRAESSASSSHADKRRKASASSSSSSSEVEDESSSDEESARDAIESSSDASGLTDDELEVKKVTKKERDNNLRIYSDSDSDNDEEEELQLKPTTKRPTQKPKIYSDSEDELEERKKFLEKELAKKTDGKDTPTNDQDDFLNDEEMLKPPRTPGRDSSPTPQTVEKVKAKIVPPPPTPPTPAADKSSAFYSDSDEEREYQEKIRRNTEYMEQIEREAQEELQRQRALKPKQKDHEREEEMPSAESSRAPSPAAIPTTPKSNDTNKLLINQNSTFDDEPSTPTASLPPPTPGAKIVLSDPMSDGSKKKRGRPKGSFGKPKEPKIKGIKNSTVKNGSLVRLDSSMSDLDIFSQPLPHLRHETDHKFSLKLSPSSSSDGGSSQASLVAMEHCYSLPPSASPSSSSSPPHHEELTLAVKHLDHDHGYYGRLDKVSESPAITDVNMQDGESLIPSTTIATISAQAAASSRPVGRPRKDPNAPKAQYNKRDKHSIHNQPLSSSESSSYKQCKKEKQSKKMEYIEPPIVDSDEPFVPVPRYEKRDNNQSGKILYEFLTDGLDVEDIDYFKRSYNQLQKDDNLKFQWVHQTHWVNHCATLRPYIPPPAKKRRKDYLPELKLHNTGCARTEGFYKIDSKDKARYKYHHLKGTAAGNHLDKTHMDNTQRLVVSKMQNASREARSNQRRLLTAFNQITESDLLKFNQLKFRKKQLKFAKSAIHDWGLFAMENIAADEMVIEYVGQMVRPSVADLRESKYEAIGIGSSYLFRIDLETIIDATKCGNLARFINHSCNVSNY